MMRHLRSMIRSLLVVCAVMALGPLSSSAQPEIAPAGPPEKGNNLIRLTEEQRVAVYDICAEARTQTIRLLSPEQLQQMAAAMGPQTAQGAEMQFLAALAPLNLTPEQQAAIDGIRKEEAEKIAAVTANVQLNTAERSAQLRTIRNAAREAMQKVFTPAQQEAFANAMARKDGRNKQNPLNLTAEQQAKIQDVRAETNTKLDAIKADATLTKAQKQAQSKAIQDAMNTQILQLLTPEQQQQMLAQREKANQRKLFTDALAELTLTPEQQGKLKVILDNRWAAIRQLLTAEQLREFEQLDINKQRKFFVQFDTPRQANRRK